MEMLKGKNAVLYGVSDSLGGAVAKAFAAQGAIVYLTALDIIKVSKVSEEINGSGGTAYAAVVDAMDREAVEEHIRAMRAKGTVDITFNLIDTKSKQNIPLVDMEQADFSRPVEIAMKSQFITMSAAGRIMREQRSGVILSLTATPADMAYPMVGGFGPACAAMESLVRGLGSELGVYGVRVVNIRSAGSPDSRPFREALQEAGTEVPEFLQKMKDDTMLKELPLMKDIANTAVFLASDMAAMITGVTVDVTAGTTTALNYRMPKNS